MAYRLKKIIHHEIHCHIVLQNENGPCPLIATANALILRGAIALDSRVIKGNVISIEELISALANWALSRMDSTAFTPSGKKSIEGENIEANSEGYANDHIHHLQQQHHQMCIHEVMEILPKLQFGLDINPKFTSGPDSFEYTSGLAIFDALGVDLVHGWISDPRDDITYKTLHGKSYNQLMDLVIKGRDATEEIRNILMTIEHKTADLLRSNHSAETANKDHPTNADWVEISEMDITETSSSNQTEKKDASSTLSTSNLLPSCSREEADRDSNLNHVENCNENSEVSSSNSAEITDSNKLIEEVSHLQKELKRNQEIETAAHIISNFLNDSSHQLTIVGLEKLSEYISDGQFCVFFRNNHFSTITKHNGHLFLLVTDLGYANVNEVVWEKLDDINGDTDYADCEFKKPRPRSTMTPSVPLLPPETVLTQQRQQDRDLQLAIRLSEGEALDDEALDEEEAALVEAAKELSLHSYNQMSTDVWSDTKPKAESASTVTDDNCSPTDTQQQEESSDYKLALQLQQQQEDLFMPQIVISDEALARQLEAEERVAAVSARRNPRPVNRNNNNVTRKSDRGSTCTVS